jgi:hypothetical protein
LENDREEIIMVRVCILKSTGELFQSMTGGDTHPDPKVDDEKYASQSLDSLQQNAIDAGYKENEIEVKWVTDAEWATIRVGQRARDLGARPYTEKRKAEYPDFYEYLDGVVKGDEGQKKKYIEDCLAIKLKYPKE